MQSVYLRIDEHHKHIQAYTQEQIPIGTEKYLKTVHIIYLMNVNFNSITFLYFIK